MTAERRAGSRQEAGRWDIELRPRRATYFAYGAAIVTSAAAVTVGLLSNVKSTGALFRAADQVAVAALGIILAGVMLLLTRPRLRVGPAGVAVRNLLGDHLIPWNRVVDVSFPVGARWARVDLPSDEYLPVLAIQSVDREVAVEAMDTVRGLLAQYRPDRGRSSSSGGSPDD